jgi:hypothetical protein
MPIYMMASRQQWADLTRSRRAVGRNVPIEAGGYCFRGVSVFWDLGGLTTCSVAAHEGLHQFLHSRLRQPLPLWLEEGLCTLAEGYRIDGDHVTFAPAENTRRRVRLQKAISAGRWIPLRVLLAMNSSDVVGRGHGASLDYYAQVWALTRFIRVSAAYRRGVTRLISDARDGRLDQAMKLPPGALARLRRHPGAYHRTIGLPLFRAYVAGDLRGFEQRYRRFARTLARLK